MGTQVLIRNPRLDYIDEGDGIQLDLVVSGDQRITFTPESIIALVDKTSELMGFDLVTRGMQILAHRYADLQTKYTALEAAVRALCDERSIEFEDELVAALRQFVMNDADVEALREMERI